MLPYRAGQFFVGATLNMYPGPKGDRQKGEGLGQIKAYNAITGKFKWEKMERFAVWGGTAATAGNVVFYGTLDGFIKARNSDTGELLWKFKFRRARSAIRSFTSTRASNISRSMYGVGGWPGSGPCVRSSGSDRWPRRRRRLQAARQLHADGRRRDGVFAERPGPIRRREPRRI